MMHSAHIEFDFAHDTQLSRVAPWPTQADMNPDICIELQAPAMGTTVAYEGRLVLGTLESGMHGPASPLWLGPLEPPSTPLLLPVLLPPLLLPALKGLPLLPVPGLPPELLPDPTDEVPPELLPHPRNQAAVAAPMRIEVVKRLFFNMAPTRLWVPAIEGQESSTLGKTARRVAVSLSTLRVTRMETCPSTSGFLRSLGALRGCEPRDRAGPEDGDLAM